MTGGVNPLEEYLRRNADGRRVHKWAHYLDLYHRHLETFRGHPVTVLEIGVQSGGSLRMWRDYFGPSARVIGVDVDPRCAQLADPDTTIVIGDQADAEFMASLAHRFGPFDVIIDDGGHTMLQQARTLDVLWPAMRTGGVLIVEDVHTSYWPEFGGGAGRDDTFIAQVKRVIDSMHARHSRDPAVLREDRFTSTLRGLHVYDSMIVFERGDVPPPEEILVGHLMLGHDGSWVGRNMPGVLARARATRAWARSKRRGNSDA